MKRILTCLIAVIFILSLTVIWSGCKEEAVPAEEAEEAPAEEEAAVVEEEEKETAPAEEVMETETISFLAYPWFALSDETLSKFTDATGIKVEIEVLNYVEANTKFVTQSAANVVPTDVFSTYVVPLASHVAAGYAEPLDSYLPEELEEDLLGLSAFRTNGQLYGIPVYYDIPTLLYNTELLEQAGIDEVPETLDDFYEACITIKEVGIVDYPFIFPLGADTGFNDRWYVLTLAYGGEIFDENYNPVFQEVGSGGYKALKLLIDSVGTIIDPAMVELTNVDVNDAFLAGDGVFIISSVGHINVANDPEVSSIVDKAAPALIPGSEGIRSATLDFYTDGLGISSLSEKKEAAWEFIEWWMSEEASDAAFEDLGVTPTRKSLLEEYLNEGQIPGGNHLFEQAEYAMSIFPSGIPVWFEEWANECAAFLNQAARGSITVEEALNNMANLAIEIQQ